MNIKTKKYLVIPVILLCLSGIVDARWHFHGGSVKDIPNRIKQAVETAKQNEVLLHIRQLSSDYKDIVAVWEPFKESVTSLYSLVFGSSHENPVSELLRTGKEIEEIKEKINERTQPDLTYKNAGQINVKETRDKNPVSRMWHGIRLRGQGICRHGHRYRQEFGFGHRLSGGGRP